MRRVRPGRGDLCCQLLFSQQTNASGEVSAKDRYSWEGDKEAGMGREITPPTNNQEGLGSQACPLFRTLAAEMVSMALAGSCRFFFFLLLLQVSRD